MNFSQVVVFTLCCILGLIICGSDAYYPYSYGRGGGGGGFGSGGFLVFIGFIFIILIIFGSFSRNTTGTNSIAVMNITG